LAVSLEVKNIIKKYGKLVALNDISFDVKPGEFFTLFGPPGVGKSSTLSIIAGINQPDSGSILMNDIDLQNVRPQDRDIAMVFESYALYPHMTVFDNMAFPLRSPVLKKEMTYREIEKRITEVAEILELAELLDRFPRYLSGGQKQRVALGRALVRRPNLFLFDEPIAHLDAKLRYNLRGKIKEMQKQIGITTIMATPSYDEALLMADRVAVYSIGKIEQIGNPAELFEKSKNETVAKLMGEHSINIFICDIEYVEGNKFNLIVEDKYKLEVGNAIKSKLQKVDGKKVKLGVRPNDVVICDIDGCDIDAEVYVYEMLGKIAIISLKVGNNVIKLRCTGSKRFNIGDKVGIKLNMDKALFFDYKSGDTL